MPVPKLIRRIGRSRKVPKHERIPGHQFEASLVLYLQGHWNRDRVKQMLEISEAEMVTADGFKTEYDSRNNVGKLKYLEDIRACVDLMVQGLIPYKKFADILDLPAIVTTTTTTVSYTTSSTTTTTVPPT